jgi:hypothetical protein
MTDIQFDDLKQLITTSASQTEKHLEGKIAEVRKEMSDGFAEVRKEMSDGFAGVADAITPMNDRIDEHELLLPKLKPHAI